MIPGHGMAPSAAAAGPGGRPPRCEHLDGLAAAGPWSVECRDCRDGNDGRDGRDGGGRQAVLAVCLTCGWVACLDDSPDQHAQAHYEETDHPVAAGLAPGSTWRWCYVHQRLV